MSMYYSPQIVRALTDERIREAQEARGTAHCQCDTRVFRPQSPLSRLFARRLAQSTCAC